MKLAIRLPRKPKKESNWDSSSEEEGEDEDATGGAYVVDAGGAGAEEVGVDDHSDMDNDVDNDEDGIDHEGDDEGDEGDDEDDSGEEDAPNTATLKLKFKASNPAQDPVDLSPFIFANNAPNAVAPSPPTPPSPPSPSQQPSDSPLSSSPNSPPTKFKLALPPSKRSGRKRTSTWDDQYEVGDELDKQVKRKKRKTAKQSGEIDEGVEDGMAKGKTQPKAAKDTKLEAKRRKPSKPKPAQRKPQQPKKVGSVRSRILKKLGRR